MIATQCRHADKYQAIRKSKCPCFMCQTKWALAELRREVDALREQVANPRGYDDTALYVANLARRC